jgi:hypothetical protein
MKRDHLDLKVKTKFLKRISLRNFVFFVLEVKIMSIPKIAISNEDDSSLRILESHLKSNPNPSSPHKSIIKTRSSQPQSPASSSTSQSFYTCHGSIRKDSLNVSIPLKRSNTISVVKNDSQQRKLRRINSYQSSSKHRSVNLETKQEINLKHRSPLETPSIYTTPKHEENSIRLIIDTDTNLSIIMKNQSDMQVDLMTDENQLQIGVRFESIENEIGFWIFCRLFEHV